MSYCLFLNTRKFFIKTLNNNYLISSHTFVSATLWLVQFKHDLVIAEALSSIRFLKVFKANPI